MCLTFYFLQTALGQGMCGYYPTGSSLSFKQMRSASHKDACGTREACWGQAGRKPARSGPKGGGTESGNEDGGGGADWMPQGGWLDVGGGQREDLRVMPRFLAGAAV